MKQNFSANLFCPFARRYKSFLNRSCRCESLFEGSTVFDLIVFKKNFVADVKILCKGFAMNPFQQDKLKKLNNSNISFPDKSIETLKCMEIKGEQDVVAFIADRLVSGRSSICKTIEK